MSTEWHDILVEKGIIPQKEVTLTEEQLTATVENVVAQKLQTGRSTCTYLVYFHIKKFNVYCDTYR